MKLPQMGSYRVAGVFRDPNYRAVDMLGSEKCPGKSAPGASEAV
jgi:hypothetical protein